MPGFTEPRKWYFVVDCLACEKPVPLAEAPSPGEKSKPLRYRVVSDIRYPHCDRVTTYASRQMPRRLVE